MQVYGRSIPDLGVAVDTSLLAAEALTTVSPNIYGAGPDSLLTTRAGRSVNLVRRSQVLLPGCAVRRVTSPT
jgi:hypothetical protein